MQRLLVALFVLLAAAVPDLAAQAGNPLAGEASLEPGDSVRITVWEEPLLSGTFEITPAGRLSHPLYADLDVAGVPLSEFETRLRNHLRQFRETPQFTFDPLFSVTVSGEVVQAGVYTLGPGVTLARAVTLAAPTRDARLDRVRLIRNRQVYVADFEDLDADWIRATVRSGDHIIVEPRLNVMRDVVGPVTGLMGSITSMISFIIFLSGGF